MLRGPKLLRRKRAARAHPIWEDDHGIQHGLFGSPAVPAHRGTNETPEFQRQNRDFVAAVKAAGKPVELMVGTSYNHFEMGESLGNPYGPNGRAALALMKLSA
jgi:hypothetical protein